MTIKVQFNPDGSIKLPEKTKNESSFLDNEIEEKDSLYSDVVNRIINIIEKNFKDNLKIVELKVMARMYTSKPLIAQCRCKYLYWVDFKKREYKNGKYGIRVHIQNIKKYGNQDYKDPEKRLSLEIAFKNSDYPCLVIENIEEMDDYFENIIRTTYKELVEDEVKQN